MKNQLLTLLICILSFSCATNPFTGKKTMAFMPNSQLLPMAFAEYDKFLSENKVVKNTSDAEMITRVGKRISVAAERWLDANNHQGYLKDYKWEYNLVDDKLVNAWCMPGGKIVFYTGILPIAKNEAGIAAIMGHEVAHALANHGQQRMSAGMIQQGVGVGVAIATKDKSKTEKNLWMQAFAVGSTVGGMLPFSRSHETEADEIGLYLTAIAGYNPDEASLLWERMKANSGGKSPPEFLSTHPSNDSRISNLRALAAKAKKEARKFGVTTFRQ
jgi:predicted Zn-dependent protease